MSYRQTCPQYTPGVPGCLYPPVQHTRDSKSVLSLNKTTLMLKTEVTCNLCMLFSDISYFLIILLAFIFTWVILTLYFTYS